jgi:mono/diheme cytochrome c family protein
MGARHLCLASAFLVALAGWSAAQDDDDAELRSGLIATRTMDGESLSEVVAEPIGWPSGDGVTRYHWTGRFLLRDEGTFQFHAHLAGRVTIRLGDRVVLEAESAEPGWVSGPETELGFGELPLDITAEVEVVTTPLRLFWSSKSFPLEPLPYHALFHASGHIAVEQATRGRQLLEAWQCRQCHTTAATPEQRRGPALTQLGPDTSSAWLMERLTRTTPGAHSRMPAYGFTPEEAVAIVAFLQAGATPLTLAELKRKDDEKTLKAGTELLKSVGCLACHTWNGLGQAPLWGGGSLDEVARRRSPAWIATKLADPHAVNRASRMPQFALTESEHTALVSVLAPIASDPIDGSPLTATEAQLELGARLVREARCAACHELPGSQDAFALVKPLSPQSALGPESCVGGAIAAARRRPQFDPAAYEALTAAMSSRSSIAAEDRPLAVGAALLHRQGCLNCHGRNGSAGLSAISGAIVRSEPSWEGQAPTLQPPPLTAVGDRLVDAALEQGVQGKLPRRLDWLKVRMPKFRHTPMETAALVSHLQGADRLPDHAPATRPFGELPSNDPAVRLAGRELTGGKGFSCVACHALKDYVPPKVALGTRGSDLYQLGERMRAPYFYRWTRSPLRMLPGVEMPSYLRPHPTFLGGDLDRQLTAIWEALHDPQFTAPTNPAVVEQLWGPSDNGRPRVLRDVVTLKPAEGPMTTVPRGLAVGFVESHSVLFDLASGGVRAWTLGDFARQRTQGKSWFWDLAGVPLVDPWEPRADFYLFDERTREVVAEKTGWNARAEVRWMNIEPDNSVRFHYVLTWSRDDSASTRTLEVYERWNGRSDGWARGVEIEAAPLGHSAWFREPKLRRPMGATRVTPSGHRWGRPIEGAERGLLLGTPSSGDGPVWVHYTTDLNAPREPLPTAPPLLSTRDSVTVLPGFAGERLPLPRGVMPTAMAFTMNGELVCTSLKGHVYRIEDSDQDGLPDRPVLLAEGLAAPFGIFDGGDGLLVAHKPEVVRLSAPDDQRYHRRMEVVAQGWGYTDDYHDWTSGIVQDAQGRFYIGLGSDYTHKNRPRTESRWRGQILRFDRHGDIEPLATGLRYPTGLTMLPGDRLVVSDQQGVQNCFNELNVITPGKRYGVPAQLDPRDDAPTEPAAAQIPHPWTRSVNGLATWPANGHPFAGQVIGAEYNGRFLIRASFEEIDGVMQGAVYPLHLPGETHGPQELLGPMSVAFAPNGDLYVGSIHDSGWLGGLNTGDIVRFTPRGEPPNGLREVRLTPRGFALDFLRPLDPNVAKETERYQISGYTRVWEGNYATPDSGRHRVTVERVDVRHDGRTIDLTLKGLKPGHVYDITVTDLAATPLWPTTAHYTLHRLPKE